MRRLKRALYHSRPTCFGWLNTYDEKKELLCIAAAGNGKYFNAPNASALAAALEMVRGEIEQNVEKQKAQKFDIAR